MVKLIAAGWSKVGILPLAVLPWTGQTIFQTLHFHTYKMEQVNVIQPHEIYASS